MLKARSWSWILVDAAELVEHQRRESWLVRRTTHSWRCCRGWCGTRHCGNLRRLGLKTKVVIVSAVCSSQCWGECRRCWGRCWRGYLERMLRYTFKHWLSSGILLLPMRLTFPRLILHIYVSQASCCFCVLLLAFCFLPFGVGFIAP